MLGTCPTLAITTAAINGIGMGVAATLVLVGSNLVISLLRNVIPDKVRIPAFITILLHIEQLFPPETYSPVDTSVPTRYNEAPSISRLDALIMAFASAWTLLHSSYRSPLGIFSFSLMQTPISEQFFLPLGAPT